METTKLKVDPDGRSKLLKQVIGKKIPKQRQ